MTLHSFYAFTVTVTPQSVMWKYRSNNKRLATPPRKANRPREFDRNTRQLQITEQAKSPQGSGTRTKTTIYMYNIKPEYKAASSHFPRDMIANPDRTQNKLDLYHRTRPKCNKHAHVIQSHGRASAELPRIRVEVKLFLCHIRDPSR